MKSSSRALKVAHILQKNAVKVMPNSRHQIPLNWSQRLQLAWYFENIREWLQKGIVTFSYWKKDGSIREAKGTLNDLFIPLDKRPHMDLQHEPNYSAVAYFDLDKQEWRSFAVTHFIGFVTVWELKEKEKKQK